MFKKFNLLAIFAILLMFASSCTEEDSSNTVTDVDGNVYHTITIGSQVWMIENLKTTRYNDGTTIPLVTNNTSWSNLTTPAYCNFNNDESNVNKYGRLYNCYVVYSDKLCPVGWHVPTIDEWTTLEEYVFSNLGKSGSLSKALASNIDWAVSSLTGTIGNDLSKNNSSGFSAYPGGYRISSNGSFADIGSYGYWWSIEGIATGLAYNEEYPLDDWSVVGDNDDYEQYGMSVRCIKDSE